MWKKSYQNSASEESLQWFADNFDDKALSMWYGEREPEVTKAFKVESYIEGIKERLGSLRKHVHMIFLTVDLGEDNFQIFSALICKGTTLIFDVSFSLSHSEDIIFFF